jgi:hypothetical protein
MNDSSIEEILEGLPDSNENGELADRALLLAKIEEGKRVVELKRARANDLKGN